MTQEGRLAYVHPLTEVDAEFVSRETTRGHPERRFRFAGPCAEGSCPQWTGCGCAIADLAADATGVERPSRPVRLPKCSIRGTCRWFHQRGADACATCPLIVADMDGTETYQSTRTTVAASARSHAANGSRGNDPGGAYGGQPGGRAEQ
jgi:hypothetical protein